MEYFEFEHTARANKVQMRDYKNGTKSGFLVKVFDINSECKDVGNDSSTTANKFQFVAKLYGDFELRASGYVADILNRVIVAKGDYFLSGVNILSDKVIEVPLYSEVSRVKKEILNQDDGFHSPTKKTEILYEKIVDIKYLAEMQNNRPVCDDDSEELKTERYLVRAAIVNATKDEESNLYKGCQHPACRAAKVLPVEGADGQAMYECTKCGFLNATFERRVMPKVELVDPKEVDNESAENITAAIFKGNAETLFEVIEKEMVRILEENGPEHFADVFSEVHGITAVFRLKANVFQDRISYSVCQIFLD